jgi:hypothetical protein
VTAPLWPAIRTTYGWVHRAAHLLGNPDGQRVELLRRAYRNLLAEMRRCRHDAGTLAPAVGTFLKVTKSYWPGLFVCYEVPHLPRTNNDLEHIFGTTRMAARRMTGQKVASPALVVRRAVRLPTMVACRTHTFPAEELRPASLAAWRALRAAVDQRQEARRAQLRFRRQPTAYLASAEVLLIQLTLPP